jgi:DNA-binding transcriptional LysR family regulator
MDLPASRQPSIRQLRAFRAVARHGSFRVAAEALALTQPAVSAAVRELEQLLGTPLFERSTHHVALTATGEALLQEAEWVLHGFDQGVAAMHRVVAQKAQRVRLAALPSAMHLVAPRVARWRRWSPPVEVELRDVLHEDLLAALVAGDIDIGLGTALDLPAGIEAVPLREDPLVAVLPAAHPLAGRRTLRWRELGGEPLALFAQGSTYELALLALRQAGVPAEPAHRLLYSEPLYSLARAGLAIGIISRLYTENAVLRGLAVVPLREPSVQRQLVLLRRARRPQGEALLDRCFADLVQAIRAAP